MPLHPKMYARDCTVHRHPDKILRHEVYSRQESCPWQGLWLCPCLSRALQVSLLNSRLCAALAHMRSTRLRQGQLELLPPRPQLNPLPETGMQGPRRGCPHAFSWRRHVELQHHETQTFLLRPSCLLPFPVCGTRAQLSQAS